MGGGPVSWKSRKQICVALSTAEVEYMSLTILAQEAIWLNCLLAELQSQLEPSKPATLYENNQSAICMTKIPNFMEDANMSQLNIILLGMKLEKGQ